jgi:Ca-activated chloride channel family protein
VGYDEFIADSVQINYNQTTTLKAVLSIRTTGSDAIHVKASPIQSAKNATVRRTTTADLEETSRTNIQGAVNISSGVTTAGVNGFSIRGGRATDATIRVDGVAVNDPYMGSFAPASPEFYPTVSTLAHNADSEGIEAQPAPEPDPIIENEFIPTMHEPTSTFGIDVDKASYSLMRRQIDAGTRPPAASMRIEELINYFHYDYPEPSGSDPFSLISEVSTCPWNPEHKLIHIGLQGRHIDMSALPPSNLVFLIDVSGSMDSPERLPLLVEGFKMMVKELRPEDNVAIVVYAGAAGVVLPSTSGADKEEMLATLDGLRAGGSTAGGAGIELAYKIAAENFKRDGNNRVILATDGDFNVGISTDDALVKLIEKKRKDGIFLTVLGFGSGDDYRDTKMEKLADNGNGSYAYIDNIGEARRALVNELSGTLFTIAKDVKLQVEFNPVTVAGYRLIGYEDRVLANEDFANDRKDAGDLGAGHSVTALYEIIPTRHTRDDAPQLSDASASAMRYQVRHLNPEALTSNELMDIRLRYKEPADSTSKLIEHPLTDAVADIGSASENFRFAAAVAELGLILRDSKYKGSASYDSLLTLARGALGADTDGARKEFIELAEKAKTKF